MKRSYGRMLFCSAFYLLFTVTATHAQFLKKLKDAANNISNAAKALTHPNQQQPTNGSTQQKLTTENGELKNLNWQPFTKYENQLFPSFIIAYAKYQGEKNQDLGSSLGFQINPTVSGVKLRWEIECADKTCSFKDSGDVRCDSLRGGLFLPHINWDYKALAKHQASSATDIYFRLIDPNTGNKVEKTVSVNLRSINDCLLQYSGIPYTYMYASYVNENHPAIDSLLKNMLATHMIDKIAGYERGADYVDLQVAALWRVLHERGFKFKGENANNPVVAGIVSQTIQTFDNTLQAMQGGSVDGTVFMASILKKMGIRPIIVSTTEHCFLGYYTSETEPQPVHYIETTAIADDQYMSKDSAKKYAKLVATISPKDKPLSDVNKGYVLEFVIAALEGQTENDKHTLDFGKNQLLYIDVDKQRQYISPIPTQN